MTEDIERVLYTKEQIAARVQEIGARIGEDYEGKNLMLIAALKGAFLFAADLSRAISLPLTVDFVSLSSYGNGTESGVLHVRKALDQSPEGLDVLVVEDIVDSGRTLAYMKDRLLAQRANSVAICTLFDKPSGRKVPLVPEYAGFTVPDAFLVGYGMDYAEKYRNLPYVGILKPEVYGGIK